MNKLMEALHLLAILLVLHTSRVCSATVKLPLDIVFRASQIEITRVLGKVDIIMDRASLKAAQREAEQMGRPKTEVDPSGRTTSVRLFEARCIDGTRCFLKEYLPIGISFGKREFSASRRLRDRWNDRQMSKESPEEDREDGTVSNINNINPSNSGSSGIEPLDIIQSENAEQLKNYPASEADTEWNNVWDSLIAADDAMSVAIPLPSETGSKGSKEMEIEGNRNFATLQKELREYESTRGSDAATPPFPVLLGSLRPDKRIESDSFVSRWRKQFPRTKPPASGNLWLVFRWDESTFKTMRRFPSLPQVVEGMDYFRKGERLKKRWRFMRKIILRGLESIDFLHRCGYCHNAINSDTIWMTTTNQVEINRLQLLLTNLGACQRVSELGTAGMRQGVAEDLYELGLVNLELIFSSFSDDSGTGAQSVRDRLEAAKGGTMAKGAFMEPGSAIKPQLSQNEWREVLEVLCESDFQSLRDICQAVGDPWKDAVTCLEADGGAAWRLIFKMLSRGRLYDPKKERPLRMSGKGLVKEYGKELFDDLEG